MMNYFLMDFPMLLSYILQISHIRKEVNKYEWMIHNLSNICFAL